MKQNTILGLLLLSLLINSTVFTLIILCSTLHIKQYELPGDIIYNVGL